MKINGAKVQRLDLGIPLPIVFSPEFEKLRRKKMPLDPLKMDVSDFAKLLVDHVDDHLVKEVMKQLDQQACDANTDKLQGKILKRMAMAIDDHR